MIVWELTHDCNGVPWNFLRSEGNGKQFSWWFVIYVRTTSKFVVSRPFATMYVNKGFANSLSAVAKCIVPQILFSQWTLFSFFCPEPTDTERPAPIDDHVDDGNVAAAGTSNASCTPESAIIHQALKASDEPETSSFGQIIDTVKTMNRDQLTELMTHIGNILQHQKKEDLQDLQNFYKNLEDLPNIDTNEWILNRNSPLKQSRNIVESSSNKLRGTSWHSWDTSYDMETSSEMANTVEPSWETSWHSWNQLKS